VPKLRFGGKPTLDDLTLAFPAGTVIFREGEPAEAMYIIQSGTVRISRVVAGDERAVALLEKGDFFGEMALLEDYPERSADAVAVTDDEALKLGGADLEMMLRGRPKIAVRMLAKLSERVREANARLGEVMAGRAETPALPPAPASQGLVARAICLHPETGRVYGLKPAGETTIGRYDPVTGTTPDIDLTSLDHDLTVSRRHAVVRADEGAMTLTEVNDATNGTFVNGVRLEPFAPHPVNDGDLVQFALVTLRVIVLPRGE
jgi:CRP-like cAMP-binding protein